MGKDVVLKKGEENLNSFLDEKKHLRHMELALQNAIERGLREWSTQVERDYYRSILHFLSETQNDKLRLEAMSLFTLSDSPDLADLTERYNLRQRISAFAHNQEYEEVDSIPYLQSFFRALLAELYADPLFRESLSDMIRVRAAYDEPRFLADILTTLKQMNDYLQETHHYSIEQLEREINLYLQFIEAKYRYHKFAGIIFPGEEEKAPELDGIFVPLRVTLQQNTTFQDKTIGFKISGPKKQKSEEIEETEEIEESSATEVNTELGSPGIKIIIPEQRKQKEIGEIEDILHTEKDASIGSKGKDEDNLLSLLEQHSYLVVLGGPGSGKSTTTSYLTWSHAKANTTVSELSVTASGTKKSASLKGKPVPLRIELRLLSEVRQQYPEYSFLSYTTHVLLGREHLNIQIEMFEILLERRGMFVLFDGLDEVPSLSERRRLVSEIEIFSQRFPGNYILVTSRPIGYDLASINGRAFKQAQIHEFNNVQIHQFLENWYTHVLKFSPLPFEARKELETLYITLKEDSRLHTLATNPLLLTVMTTLHRYHRLPDERVMIYEECAELLLDTWARLKYDRDRWKGAKMGIRVQEACLAHLGFVLHERSRDAENDNEGSIIGTVDVPERFLRKEILSFLADQNILSGAEQHAEAERFLELFRIEAGLIVSRGTDEYGEPIYGFVHRTFQEYFAAVDILNRFKEEADVGLIRNFLAAHIHDPHWHEVILLLLGKLPHKITTAQLRLILQENTSENNSKQRFELDLFFVCDCLADDIAVEKDFAKISISALCGVVNEALNSENRERAINTLLALLRTRHYTSLGKEALLTLIGEKDEPLPMQLQIVQAIYQYTTEEPDELHEIARSLLNRFQDEELLFEQ